MPYANMVTSSHTHQQVPSLFCTLCLCYSLSLFVKITPYMYYCLHFGKIISLSTLCLYLSLSPFVKIILYMCCFAFRKILSFCTLCLYFGLSLFFKIIPYIYCCLYLGKFYFVDTGYPNRFGYLAP